MIRCPTCGRRLRDAAPVCATHGAPPPVVAAAARRHHTVRGADARPADLPRAAHAGAGGVRRRLSGRADLRRTDGRHQGRPRRQRFRRREFDARGVRALRGRCPARPGGVRAGRPRRRLGLRGDGVRAGAAAGRATDRPVWSDGARRVRTRCAGDPGGGRDGAPPRLRPLRSQTGESVRRRNRRQAVRFWAGPQRRRRGRSGRVDQGRGPGRDARVHVARAV